MTSQALNSAQWLCFTNKGSCFTSQLAVGTQLAGAPTLPLETLSPQAGCDLFPRTGTLCTSLATLRALPPTTDWKLPAQGALPGVARLSSPYG